MISGTCFFFLTDFETHSGQRHNDIIIHRMCIWADRNRTFAVLVARANSGAIPYVIIHHDCLSNEKSKQKHGRRRAGWYIIIIIIMFVVIPEISYDVVIVVVVVITR